MWVWVVVIVALIGAVAVVVVGRADTLADVYDDRPDTTIPTGRPITADDLHSVRFTTAVRGYRMDEVDSLLSRLQADLLAREQRDPPITTPDPTPPFADADDSREAAGEAAAADPSHGPAKTPDSEPADVKPSASGTAT